jgi:hypothetical protein
MHWVLVGLFWDRWLARACRTMKKRENETGNMWPTHPWYFDGLLHFDLMFHIILESRIWWPKCEGSQPHQRPQTCPRQVSLPDLLATKWKWELMGSMNQELSGQRAKQDPCTGQNWHEYRNKELRTTFVVQDCTAGTGGGVVCQWFSVCSNGCAYVSGSFMPDWSHL